MNRNEIRSESIRKNRTETDIPASDKGSDALIDDLSAS